MTLGARAWLKISTGRLCRGSAGRAFGRAIKKSPGVNWPGLINAAQTICKPTRNVPVCCIGPMDWAHSTTRAGETAKRGPG
jgi:hypothetical protein